MFVRAVLPFIALGTPVIYQGQEFLATQGSQLPYRDPLHTYADVQSNPYWTVNNIGYPPTNASVAAAAAAATALAGKPSAAHQSANTTEQARWAFLRSFESFTGMYANSSLGLGGELMTIFQNCSSRISVRKWRMTSAPQQPVYVLASTVPLPQPPPSNNNTVPGLVMEYISMQIAADDAVSNTTTRAQLVRVFEYGKHLCAANLTLTTGTVYHCLLGPNSVVVYSTAAPVMPASFASVDQPLPVLGPQLQVVAQCVNMVTAAAPSSSLDTTLIIVLAVTMGTIIGLGGLVLLLVSLYAAPTTANALTASEPSLNRPHRYERVSTTEEPAAPAAAAAPIATHTASNPHHTATHSFQTQTQTQIQSTGQTQIPPR